MKKWLAILLVCAMLLAATTCATAEAGSTGELPVKWDLNSIYASVEEWQADYDEAMGMLDRYEEFRGTLNNAQSIYDYLQFVYYTELTEKQMKLELYAHLGSALNSTDPVFTELNAKLEAMTVKESQLSAFATPEIYALPLEERDRLQEIEHVFGVLDEEAGDITGELCLAQMRVADQPQPLRPFHDLVARPGHEDVGERGNG